MDILAQQNVNGLLNIFIFYVMNLVDIDSNYYVNKATTRAYHKKF